MHDDNPKSKIQNPKSLQELLDTWQAAVAHTGRTPPSPYHGPDVLLTDLVEHSDLAAPGACFVARVRTGSDGHAYVGRAVANGASLIIGQRPLADLPTILPSHVPYWQVADTAETLAWLSAAWYGFPGRQLVVIGVTGTDGKTTTVNLIYHILRAAGLKAGMISTVYAALGDADEPLALHVTTPEAPVIQRYLRRMVDAGLTHCVLEVTSHALAQHRVTGIDFDLAVVTNVTHEHLDYHGRYEDYLAAKARLFEGLTGGKWQVASGRWQVANPKSNKAAVLNRDDQSYPYLVNIPAPAQITYGLENPADVSATDLTFAADQTRFTLVIGAGEQKRENHPLTPSPLHPLTITTPLVGRFNVYNMLAAAAAAMGLGIEPAAIQAGLQALREVSGRMERIDAGQPFLVIVDFAHTPNALSKAIEAARAMTQGRIIVVFGSAGKRDVIKRRLMAEIAARQADLTVLTAEDPRTESLADILAMMAEGCRSQGGREGQTFWRAPDRGQAIYHALTLARPGDLVLICGKGHEQSMCFGDIEYPWDDRQATRAALTAFLAGRPMPDLGLPTYGGQF